MKKAFSNRFAFLMLGIFMISGACLVDESKAECVGVELLSGYAKAKLEAKGDYILSPFIVDIDYNLKPLTEKIGINPASLLQFQLEPFISPVYEPDANIEVGNGFILKAGLLPETSKFQPYVKGGTGFLFMSQHSREQGTQFNFFEYGAVGMHYYFKKNTAVTLEYRYRHLSNCSIKSPNSGINTQFALLGLAYQF